MSEAAALSLAVVCEAAADLRLVTDLADRVFCEEIDWIEPQNLELHRSWRGLKAGESHLEWHWVPRLAKQQNHPKAHGHFGDEPGAQDAFMARKALLLLAGEQQRPDAVILVRDTDAKRRRGLIQAREAAPWPFKVVLAVIHTKRECWVLAGFEPNSEAERQTLAALRQELGFDPRLKAENLTAAKPQALRNAKRVLGRLTTGNEERERRCWVTSDLETLRERGQGTGLADYLDEVRERLVPMLTGHAGPSGRN